MNNLHHQLEHAIGGFDPNLDTYPTLSTQDIEKITAAEVVTTDDTADPVEQALTNAVTGPPSMGLNWGAEGDEALTRWFNGA